jgi:hypothetical protein
MQRNSWLPALRVLAAVSIMCTVACQGTPQTEPPSDAEYIPTATVKDLMQSIVDESADVVWLAVTAVHTAEGVKETRPRSDGEWNGVRLGAIALAESANLLLMPGRRVARPGETSETPGVELEPEEMDALIAENRADWNMRARALHEAATKALSAIEAQDADRLFEIGEEIEHACEGCHSAFWYPNEVLPPLPELIEQ